LFNKKNYEKNKMFFDRLYFIVLKINCLYSLHTMIYFCPPPLQNIYVGSHERLSNYYQNQGKMQLFYIKIFTNNNQL